MQKIRQIRRTDFEKSKKPNFWANLGQNIPNKIFFKNRAPLFFRAYNYLPSCKKSEKTNDPVLRKAVDKEKTDAQTHARTDTGQFIGPYLW